MSPTRIVTLHALASVPRASGDEPEQKQGAYGVTLCSPRERG